jgi:hypothetical protein
MEGWDAGIVLVSTELGSIKVKLWRMKTLSMGGDLSEAKSMPVGVILEKELKGRALTLAARSHAQLKADLLHR